MQRLFGLTLPWVMVAAALTAAGAQAEPAGQSFFLGSDDLVQTTLWMHMTNDGTPLRGGNDSTVIGFMNVRPPEGSSILVGTHVEPGDCTLPAVVPSGSDTWMVGVSPDRIPLPEDINYNHYHWQDANMAFTLGDHLDLVWYAGLAPVGALEPAGTADPPVQARLSARLVLGHTAAGPEGIDQVVDVELASGVSEPVAIGDRFAEDPQRITVDGYNAYRFQVRLDVAQTEVPAMPSSQLRLLLRMQVTDPTCGGVSGPALSQMWPFAATAPEGRSLLFATASPPRVERLEVQAAAEGGFARAQLLSPWGEAAVDASLAFFFEGKELATLPVVEPAVHEDFHPRFNGNSTWTWGATGPGRATVDLIYTSPGIREAYLEVDVPRRGNVTCIMEYPEPAVCTGSSSQEVSGPVAPLVVMAVAGAVALARRRSSA